MHPVRWLTAQPLWSSRLAAADRDRFRQPAVLRFAGDDFMEQLDAALTSDPSSIAGRVARPETWRDAPGTIDGESLKLYQAVHGRYYLVAASLVCAEKGLPDRKVERGKEENVFFVLRRLVDTEGSGYEEQGWVGEGASPGWQAVAPGKVLTGEERLALFPASFATGQAETRGPASRRLFCGLIPVSSRETFEASGSAAIPEPSPEAERMRLGPVDSGVLQPLANILDFEGENVSDPATRPQIRQTSLFILLDLGFFLEENHPTVWAAVQDSALAPGLTGAHEELYDALSGTNVVDSSVGQTWVQAVKAVAEKRTEILATGTAAGLASYDLDDSRLNGLDISDALDDPEDLLELFEDALEEPTVTPEVPELPKIDPTAGHLYAVRCVYERPRCRGLVPHHVSELSATFQLASFFDPDAPVRPLRVTLPVDTSLAGLRKFPKGVSFLVSNQLRQQMQRVRNMKLEDLDEGEMGDSASFNLGMICSFSIPIITLCALILLMIIVQLLNIVFWWLPLFRICRPLNLKA